MSEDTLVNFEYEERIIAFIDILGFKALIEETNTNSQENNNEAIAKLISIYRNIKRLLLKQVEELIEEVKVTSFSDCLVISLPVNQKDGLFDLALALLHFQGEIFNKFNVLIRGGITHGKLIHQDDFLFGPAMNRAYELESQFAKNPRIIIDPDLLNAKFQYLKNQTDPEEIDELKNELESLFEGDFSILKHDQDDYYYIDYLITFQAEMDDPEIDFPKYIRQLESLELSNNEPSLASKFAWITEKITHQINYLDSLSLDGST
ncbi:hypothetical protein QE380_002689 [Acinetobacter baylyi]|uniref:Guanylate cyclase domain-containing protein n=1 Tax=Acinetobacter baylyi TaxID=202950 RepID=A0ABU0UZ02_ACIBI|nr:hypothetical protein [Acinetobacter baylyi]MDQ1209766.1 hypothetical protein [Acinetobacter baylyi]MDR6106638.1 hypothetical protein [Acinetobacter baylyi]MDR6186635.1 hypothetical protein [Acinetobacter baylyi]